MLSSDVVIIHYSSLLFNVHSILFVYSGLDSEDSLVSGKKKRERRVWTDDQEDTLINILEELVANGYARKNGTFKPGMSAMIENASLEKFPNSILKYSPHVESKIKDF